MVTTANLIDLQLLLEASHGDPHLILGMHELEKNRKEILVVRTFIPNAKRITVKDPNSSKSWPLAKIHAEGFFEGQITGRKKWFRYILEMEDENGGTWESYDPYSFMPVISDLDIHLFKEGTHYRIYEKLGANPMTLDGVPGVLFAVWAPNAARVSVIGEFNNWDGRRHAMRTLANSGIWELFIPEMPNLEKYKFEVKLANGALVQTRELVPEGLSRRRP